MLLLLHLNFQLFRRRRRSLSTKGWNFLLNLLRFLSGVCVCVCWEYKEFFWL